MGMYTQVTYTFCRWCVYEDAFFWVFSERNSLVVRSDTFLPENGYSVVDYPNASEFFIEREQMFYDDRDDGLGSDGGGPHLARALVCVKCSFAI